MSQTTGTDQHVDGVPVEDTSGPRIAAKPFKRFVLGQTAVDFWGRRWITYGISAVLLLLSVISLSTRGLNLSIDFEGGVAYDVPAGAEFGTDQAREVLADFGITGSSAKVELRRSSSGDSVKVQVAERTPEEQEELQIALAEAASVSDQDVSVSAVSASWGSEITRKAIIALIVFIGLLAIVISIRFEWRMAVAAIAAMLHDIAIAAGLYSIFGFEVTPATVVAFLSILGYSLYDTIVVFDRVKENERRVIATGLTAEDLVNISTNQVLLRSLNTSISGALPVVSLLVIGSLIMGQTTLQEFALALLIGTVVGAYSSLFIATPFLGWLKGAGLKGHQWLTGDDLRQVVVRGVGSVPVRTGRRRARAGRTPAATESSATGTTAAPPRAPSLHQTPEQLLQHAPRPRKKKRH